MMRRQRCIWYLIWLPVESYLIELLPAGIILSEMLLVCFHKFLLLLGKDSIFYVRYVSAS